LLAHLCYTAAFICRSGAGFSAWSAAPFLLYCVCLLQLLWPAVGSLRWAVAGYGFVISGMAWAAFEAWRGTARRAALLAFAGAVLFVLSDSALAYDRFVARFEAAPTVILLAYFAAQLLIALSIGR